ncbi:complement decay-accelerating factor, GPI-anchored isoform X3 [Arvicanthis niloticus]|uniref:complement decay-accelerating factor, GPI-anchored isoform X3 n=1 Tax=Arvicanthis niloticus TaxID=61156 RepID=UPI001486459D|nr:complement decay-accelerating factor isoform X1 [Arvicanthis niloticus]
MIRVRATGIPAPPLLPPLLMLSLSLLLLLLSPTAQGDCGPPPDIPNATPDLSRHTTFAKNTKVTYSCNKGYKQIPGKSNIVVCLGTGEWSGNETFCNKTCNGPQRVKFATLKQEYISVNFFPIGTTVEYKCRPGFVKVPSVSAKSTCLEELVWSPVGEFCKKKACHNPGELQNGHITILTDILFGAEISFSCDEGYRLVGVTSTFCTLSVGRDTENPTVDWEDAFPECKEIICPGPPDINNGKIQEESDSYKFNQVVTYSCAEGFTLVGNTNIVCIEKSDHGEWSGPPPKCIEKSKITTKKPTVNVPRIPSTTQKSTVDVSSTKIPPTPQKPTTVIVPSTRIPATPAKTTTVLVPATQNVPAIKTTVHHPTRTSKDKGESNSGVDRFVYGKFDSWGVKRNCHHCGKHSPYFWKRILSYNCLRKTIKMQCLWAPKGRRVNHFNRLVLWTPLGIQYSPSHSQQCCCSKVVLGQLQVIWPISQIALSARCVNMSF